MYGQAAKGGKNPKGLDKKRKEATTVATSGDRETASLENIDASRIDDKKANVQLCHSTISEQDNEFSLGDDSFADQIKKFTDNSKQSNDQM